MLVIFIFNPLFLILPSVLCASTAEASHKLACFHSQSPQMHLLSQLLPHPDLATAPHGRALWWEQAAETRQCPVLLQRQDHVAAGRGEPERAVGRSREKLRVCARTGRL